jgi:hypothetical protein
MVCRQSRFTCLRRGVIVRLLTVERGIFFAKKEKQLLHKKVPT